MAWERRRNGLRYYYRLSRQAGNGQIIKTYVGGGEVGRAAAEADQAGRDALRQSVRVRKEEGLAVEELSALVDELGGVVDQLVACQLVSAGWRMHNRQWRSPKHGRIRRRNSNA